MIAVNKVLRHIGPMASPSVQHPEAPSRGMPLWLLTLFTILAVGAWLTWSAVIDYKLMVDGEYTLMEASARHRAARINGLVRSCEIMLASLDSELVDNHIITPVGMVRLLKERIRQWPEAQCAMILDHSGKMVASSTGSTMALDGSLPDYFTHLRDTDNQGSSHPLFITKPYKMAPGVWSVLITRALHDRAGRFNGVAVIFISQEKFREILQSVTSELNEGASVIHEAGDFIYDIPHQDRYAGRNLVGGIAYTQHMASGQASTRHRGVDKNTHRDLVTVFQNVAGTPLIVISGRPFADMIRHWRQQLVERISGFVVLVAMLMFLARLAWGRQKALEVLNQRLIQLARTDPLTGCSNRRSILEALETEKVRAERYAKAFSVLAVDLDHFKTINDRYGHPGGDQALCQFVAIVGGSIRPSDCLGRVGGEEFAILLPETSVDAAFSMAERVRMAVAAAVVQMPAGAASMTVSIGVAQWRLEGPDTTEALLARADEALYEAKRAGRNQVRAMG